jgi:hypothetical protein
MISGKNGSVPSLRGVLLGLAVLFLHSAALARAPVTSPSPPDLAVKVAPAKKAAGQDDSFILTPPKDLGLQPENVRKADALADFVEGARLEENAEMENALAT